MVQRICGGRPEVSQSAADRKLAASPMDRATQSYVPLCSGIWYMDNQHERTKKRKGNVYTFWGQFYEKPSVIPGSPA